MEYLWSSNNCHWRHFSLLRQPQRRRPTYTWSRNTPFKRFMEWKPISERIITARFTSKGCNITCILCYAPTNTDVSEERETFHQQLQSVFQKAHKKDIKIVMGDMNAGKDNSDWKRTMGTEGLGQMNKNGFLFLPPISLFPHKQTHKSTWISTDHHTEYQITLQ